MDLEKMAELFVKQEILNGSRKEWNGIVNKYNEGQELTKDEIEFLLISGIGMIGIIQEELLDPQMEEMSGNWPAN